MFFNGDIQVDKVLIFKSRVCKVKINQITSGLSIFILKNERTL
jgi:hypothetical protein